MSCATASVRRTTRCSPAWCSSCATARTARRSPATWRCRAYMATGRFASPPMHSAFINSRDSAPGTYAVVQIHPSAYTDHRDMPGLTGGYAVNPDGIPATPRSDRSSFRTTSRWSSTTSATSSATTRSCGFRWLPASTRRRTTSAEVTTVPVLQTPPPFETPPPEPPVNVYGEPNFPANPLLYKLPPLPTRIPDWIGGSSKCSATRGT